MNPSPRRRHGCDGQRSLVRYRRGQKNPELANSVKTSDPALRFAVVAAVFQVLQSFCPVSQQHHLLPADPRSGGPSFSRR